MRRELTVLALVGGAYAVALLGLPAWADRLAHPLTEAVAAAPAGTRLAQLTTRPGVGSEAYRENNRANEDLLRRQSESGRQQFDLDQLRRRSETDRSPAFQRPATCPPGLTC